MCNLEAPKERSLSVTEVRQVGGLEKQSYVREAMMVGSTESSANADQVHRAEVSQ